MGETKILKEGDSAPEFELKDTEENLVKSSDLKGSKVVFFFYPRDMTPGCTTEACQFRDSKMLFDDLKVKVFGVSLDDVPSHAKFTKRHDLNFPLLADVEQKLSEAFGVYGRKNFMGKSYMGINRTTFIVDENWKVSKVFENVKPDGHSMKVLDELK